MLDHVNCNTVTVLTLAVGPPCLSTPILFGFVGHSTDIAVSIQYPSRYHTVLLICWQNSGDCYLPWLSILLQRLSRIDNKKTIQFIQIALKLGPFHWDHYFIEYNAGLPCILHLIFARRLYKYTQEHVGHLSPANNTTLCHLLTDCLYSQVVAAPVFNQQKRFLTEAKHGENGLGQSCRSFL
jgi:hypothetical protein